MKGRLFLIHWKAEEAEELAAPLREAGWEVETKGEDGARAGKSILADPPDAVVISLRRLPSHGRETAHGLRSYKAGRGIRIVFFDGKEEAVAKTREKVPDAEYVTYEDLLPTLDRSG